MEADGYVVAAFFSGIATMIFYAKSMHTLLHSCGISMKKISK